MFTKKNLVKEPLKRREDYIRMWTDFKETLKNQEVEVSFKVKDKYFPESMRSVSSPYLCELEDNELIFLRFNPQTVGWKKKQDKIFNIKPELIENMTIATRTDLDFIFGPFPNDITYLELIINFKNEEQFRLYSQSILIVKEISNWCDKNKVELIDNKNMITIINHSDTPLDKIKKNSLNAN